MKDKRDSELYVTPKEAATIFKVSEEEIWRRLERGELSAWLLGEIRSKQDKSLLDFEYAVLPPQGVRRVLAEGRDDFSLTWTCWGSLAESTAKSVRQESIRVALPESVNAIDETPIGTKERNVLLCIIAALSQEAKIDLKKPSKAAAVIHDMVTKIGLSIGESTIEGHIKKIPDALERRMK